MHEANRDSEQMDRIEARLGELNDNLMGLFVQMTRLYDITAASLAGMVPADIVTILDMHEQGKIFSSAPVLKEFDAQPSGEDGYEVVQEKREA